jgi:hypothetical protein
MSTGGLSATALTLALLATGCIPPSNEGKGPASDDATFADGSAAPSWEPPPVPGTAPDVFDATAIDATSPDGQWAGDASSGDAVPSEAGIAAIADASGKAVVDSGLGPACHTSSECAAGSYCLGALGGSCTMGCPATQCNDNSQCEGGTTCRSIHPTATCAAGPGVLYCMPPCQTRDDCPIESDCYSGSCAPSSCTFGVIPCPGYAHCVGADMIALCVSSSCKADSDCPTGYCVNGVCQHILGACAPSCD